MIERETEADPAIDMTAPGSDTDQADGAAAQLPYEDMLEPHVTDDVLDEGYSPPDRPPAVDVPTPAEERDGETLDQRLAEERPDTGSDPEDWSMPDSSAGERRAGRLTPEDRDGSFGQSGDDTTAEDAGVAGGAASSEEAAMHVVDEADGDPRR